MSQPIREPREGLTQTTPLNGAKVGSERSNWRKTIRTRLRKRFRMTACPCFREAFTRSRGRDPSRLDQILTSNGLSRGVKGRGGVSGTAWSRRCTTRKRPATRTKTYRASTWRPLARRRLSTMRPFLVFMRLRNPWVLARRRLLGWKVRFIVHLKSPLPMGRANLRAYQWSLRFSSPKSFPALRAEC